MEGLTFAALGRIAPGPGRPCRWRTAGALATITALVLLGMFTISGVAERVVVF